MTVLERELTEALGPVRAPESLWYRVDAELAGGAGSHRRRFSSGFTPAVWLVPALTAACLILILLNLRNPALAVHQGFLRHPDRLDLVQCQPTELHDWLAHNAGLAVKFAARPQAEAGSVRILGARKLGEGRAAVFYRVGKYPLTLLIGHGGRSTAKHVKQRNLILAGVTLFEWEAHGQAFTLVSSIPGGSQQGCHLCHV